MMMSVGGMSVRSSLADIRIIGRATQGVRLINLKDDDTLTSVARIEDENKDLNGDSDD